MRTHIRPRRLTFEVPFELAEQLRAASFAVGETQSELVRRGIQLAFDSLSAEQREAVARVMAAK